MLEMLRMPRVLAHVQDFRWQPPYHGYHYHGYHYHGYHYHGYHYYLFKQPTTIVYHNSQCYSIIVAVYRPDIVDVGIMGFKKGANEGRAQMGVDTIILPAFPLQITPVSNVRNHTLNVASH